jgi:predicted outer membrane repeat protein
MGTPIIYVRAGATGANNGNSWTNAYTSLQSALASAPTGSEIWVGAGVYKPTTTSDRTLSFNLKQGVEIYGGFAGNESSREQRNWEVNRTILSGDIRSIGASGDNSYHVVSASSSITSSTRLDGFNIQDGNGDRAFDLGAGIYNVGGSPILANLLITNNSAYSGGGMSTSGGNPEVINVTFNNNTALSTDGGAIYSGVAFDDGGITLKGVTFINNKAESDGGAIYNYYSNLGLTNVSFLNNTAKGDGGAIVNQRGTIGLNYANFVGNKSNDDGGAIYSDDGETAIINSTFRNNSASGSNDAFGGAVSNRGGTNNLINVVLDNKRYPQGD